MEGPPTLPGESLNNSKYSQQAGVITRCVNYIFQKLESSDAEYIVKVSHLELYNEDLFDLLNPSNSESLKLFEDPSKVTSVSVHGLTEITVYNSADIFNILQESWKARTSAPTLLNHNSRYS
jgi:hypothetical protein